MDVQEQILLSQLKLNDDKAFTTLYNKYWYRLYRHTQKKIRSNEIAEEIVHDIFADLWFRRHTILITTSLEAYLFQSVRYATYKYIRTLKNKEVFITELTSVMKNNSSFSSNQSEYIELNELLSVSLEHLPQRCRTIFELSRLKQFSHREISEELSITVKTVENQISKAIRILKVALKDYTYLLLFFLFN